MATYRDDREALRDRSDRLERELAEAQSALRVKEVVISHADAEIDRLRKKAGERPARSSATAAVWFVAAGLGVVVLAGAALGFVMVGRTSPGSIATPPQLPAVQPVASPPPDSMPTEAARTNLRFGAIATAVKGRADVAVGASCEIHVDTANVAGRLSFEEVVVRCGDVELHRLSEIGGTISSMMSWAAGPASDDAQNRWIASYEDLGARSADARSQAAFDSERQAGRVFTEGAAPTEVVLKVDRLATVQGAP